MSLRIRHVSLFIVSLVILLIIISSEPVHRDESVLTVTLAESKPLWLLGDNACIEEYRTVGYNITAGFQNKFWNVFFKTAAIGDEYACRYQLSELMRLARLDSVTFQTRYYLGLLRMLSESPDNMDRWLNLWKVRWKFFGELRSGGAKGPTTEKKLLRHLKKIEEYGFDKWCFMDYEIAADYYFASQRDSTAFEYLKKAYRSTLETNHTPICSHLAGRIGAYLSREGKFDEAMNFYRASLEFAGKANDPYFISRALSFTSFLKASMGEFAIADSLMRKALEYCGMTMDPICEISKLVGLARLYNSFGETGKALYHLKRAILIAIEKMKTSRVRKNKYLSESMNHYLATAYSLKGRINLKLGEVQDAVRSISHALDIYRNALDRYSESQMLKLLADAYAASGEFEKAENLYSKAVSIVTRLKKRRKLAEYMTSLGTLHLKRGRTQRSREILEEAMKIANAENYWMQKIDIGYALAEVHVSQGDTLEAVKKLERSIWIYSHNLGKVQGTGDKRAQAEKVNELFTNLFDLLYSLNTPADSFLSWREKQYTLINNPKASNNLKDNAYHKIIDTAQRQNDRLTLRYIRGSENYYLISISSEGVGLRKLRVNVEKINELAAKVAVICKKKISDSNNALDGDVVTAGNTINTLYDILLGNLEIPLRSKKYITVIPDGELFSIPFEILLTWKKKEYDKSGIPYVSYLPSLCFVDTSVNGQKRKINFDNALVIINPHQAGWVLQRYPTMLDLEKTEEETAFIRKHVKRCIVLEGEKAKKDSVTTLMQKAELIHFATHTVYHPEYEGQPSLLLASGKRPQNMDDITIGPDEIKNMNLKAELVVLATCESSSEREKTFRQELGLAEAFLVAGAKRVIAVRNVLRDKDAALFFEKFYRNLFEKGMKVEEAFHSARNMLYIEEQNSGGPDVALLRWSSFVLISPPTPDGGETHRVRTPHNETTDGQLNM